MTDATRQQDDAAAPDDAGAAVDESALWTELEAQDAPRGDDGTAPSDRDRDADVHDGDGGADQGSDPGAAAGDAADGSNTHEGGDRPDGKTPSGDAARQQDQVDIWAAAAPEQRAAFEAAQQQLARLEHENRSNRGRIAALQRQTAAAPRQAASAEAAAGRDAGSGTGDFLASDDWKSFEKEYPEVAGPLGKVVGALEQKATRFEKELSAIGDDRRQQALDEQGSLLTGQHPDWQQVVGGNQDSFRSWLDHQPRHVRDAAVRNAEEVVDAEEAADVVGRFKAFLAARQNGTGGDRGSADERPLQGGNGNHQAQQPLSDKRKRQLESASTARSRGPGAATGIPDDEEGAWKAFEKMGL